jgi:hypothetical protein
MYNNYDYPVGADNSNAPWNEEDNKERKFDMYISYTISKPVKVYTNDYRVVIEEDEDGTYEAIDTKDTNWSNVCIDNGLDISIFFKDVKKLILEKINKIENKVRTNPSVLKTNYEYLKLKQLESFCDNWTVDDFDIVEP